MEDLMSYWYRALHAEHGIELVCSNVIAIRDGLYRVRKEAQDEDLSQISINVSPFDPSKLWLVKRKPTDETP